MSLDINSVPYVFSCIYSYQNLQRIILNNKYNFIIKLNVKHDYAFDAIISCLNLLKNCDAWTPDVSSCSTFGNFSSSTLTTHRNKRTRSKTTNTYSLSCPAIEYLLIRDLNLSAAIYLCKYAPKLTHLQIRCPPFIQKESYQTSIKSFFPRMNLITNLHIETFNRNISFNFIKRLILACRSSLQHLTLIANDIYGFNGQTLEKLFYACKKLKKLAFHIEYYDREEVDMIEQLRQFQSAWWLDDRRPPVFVYHGNRNYRVIASMPCSSLIHSLTLPTDLTMWPLNKGHFGSTQIYFTRVTSIFINNSNQRPILLDFLHLISQVFPSRVEYLEFEYWKFKDPRALYELLTNTTVMTPYLPSIINFKTSKSNWNELDGTTLIIWLLLTPNIREFQLPGMNNAHKIQLGEELNTLFTINPCLKIISNRIERVIINWSFDSHDDQTKPEIFNLFAQMFPKAIICNI